MRWNQAPKGPVPLHWILSQSSCEIATFDQGNATLSAKQWLCRMLDCTRHLADAGVTLQLATALIHICQYVLWTWGWWRLPRSFCDMESGCRCASKLWMWVALLVWLSLGTAPLILEIFCSWTLPPAMPLIAKSTFQLLWWAASGLWKVLPLLLWKSVWLKAEEILS